MGGFLKCVDPDDPNKFLLIRDGEIVFYENINGVPTPVTPMTQIGLYDAAGGESFTPNERYKEAPEVFVQPRSIRTSHNTCYASAFFRRRGLEPA